MFRFGLIGLTLVCCAMGSCVGGGAAAGLPEVPAPSSGDPVNWGAAVSPATARIGAEVEIIARARIAPTWHITPREAKGLAPLSLELSLPAGVEPVGEWSGPAAGPDPHTGVLVHQGAPVFRRRLRIAAAVPGSLTLTLTASYQACDPQMCLPPQREEHAMKLEVIP